MCLVLAVGWVEASAYAAGQRRLLGSTGGRPKELDPELSCDDPESMLQMINFPEKEPEIASNASGFAPDLDFALIRASNRRLLGSGSEAKNKTSSTWKGIEACYAGCNGPKRCKNKCIADNFKHCHIGCNGQTNCVKKCTAEKRWLVLDGHDNQELCCPQSKQCFTFCHRNCPGITVQGVGTVYAQYRLAGRPKRNQKKIVFPSSGFPNSLRGAMGMARLGRKTPKWGSVIPCTASKEGGIPEFCENQHAPNQQSATSFTSQKETLATNGKCALKWGFVQHVYRAIPGAEKAEIRLGSSLEESKKDSALANVFAEKYSFQVDELKATLCNMLTGQCAQRKAMINCIKNRASPGSVFSTKCTLGEAMSYGSLV
jgi:hypothetical protein